MRHEEIQRLANLSKINITPEEEQIFENKFNQVMQMIDTIKNIDCTGIEPLTSVIPMNLRTRRDKMYKVNDVSAVLSNVSTKNVQQAKDLQYFTVPKVIE